MDNTAQISTAILIAMMIVIAIIETASPQQTKPRDRVGDLPANLVFMVITFALNFGLNASAVVLISKFQLYANAPLAISSLPLWAVFIISLLVLDFGAYLAHRLMHSVPWLWRIHSVHHTDRFVDVTTSFRQHPIEGLWRFIFLIVPVCIFGIPAEVLVVYRFTSASFALLEHANLRVPHSLERLLNSIVVTPNFHKIHHSRFQPETDSNYGNILTIFDRFLFSITALSPKNTLTYGLDGYQTSTSQTIMGMLRLPFSALPQTRITNEGRE